MPMRMHLAFDLSYIHMEGRWRMPGAWAGGRYRDVVLFEEIARIAERGLLDMLFSGDGTGVPSTWQQSRGAAVRWGVSWPRQDLAPMAVAMSWVTKHLRFGVTYSTTFMHPYYMARLFNSLDHVTGGRIAFNVITSIRRSDYANYGYDEIVNHDERYDRMEEFIGVCRAPWGSVEPDAMVWDEATGRVGDAAKVHDVEHRGKFFEIGGPLNTPPSPQGRPVLLQAGNSPRGVRASAYVADMVFGADMPLELQIKQRKMLDDALISIGRDPKAVGIVWQQPCVVAETEAEAAARRELLLDAIPAEGVGVYLLHNGGYDFSPCRSAHARPTAWRDDRQPGLARRLHARAGDPARRGHRDHSRRIFRLRPAVRDQLHAHDRRHRGAGRRHRRREVRGGQPCGFMLGHVVSMPYDLAAIVDLLVPELQRRGRFRHEYKGTTLRENLLDDD